MTAIPAPLTLPELLAAAPRPVLDARRPRGKHRAARTLNLWGRSRAEFATAAAATGALAAAVLS